MSADLWLADPRHASLLELADVSEAVANEDDEIGLRHFLVGLMHLMAQQRGLDAAWEAKERQRLLDETDDELRERLREGAAAIRRNEGVEQ